MTIWHYYIPLFLLFGVWSTDRFVHLVWASGFFMFFLVIAAGYKSIREDKSKIVQYWYLVTNQQGVGHYHAVVMGLFVLYLGSWVPDLDWKFGLHRSPITHSVIPYLLMSWAAKSASIGIKEWNERLLPLFGFALGSHLIVDYFQGGNLVGVSAKYEIFFYMANGFVLCIWSYRKMVKCLQSSKPNNNLAFDPNTAAPPTSHYSGE